MRRKELLTSKEKFALYYLVKYPISPDRELAERTKLKLSTVTAIRRRLRAMGLYRGINIGLLTNLGAELLTVSYGTLDRLVKGVDESFYKGIGANTFYMCTDGLHELAIGYERNYTTARKNIDIFTNEAKAKGLSLNNWNTLFFPAETTYIFRLFDYSPIVRTLYDVDISAAERKIKPFKLYSPREKPELTKKEKIGFAGFLAVPEGTDVEVSNKSGLSRQAVASMRRRFTGSILLPIRDIALDKLGLELLVLTHDRFNLGMDIEKKIETIADSISDFPAFFAVANNSDAIYLSAHRSYSDYIEAHKKRVATIVKSSSKMIDSTTTVLYSLRHLSMVKDFAFLEIAGAMLGLPKL
ncbi:MAG: hypothetical protein ACPL1Y_00745 [Thermoplasmata archaeon]